MVCGAFHSGTNRCGFLAKFGIVYRCGNPSGRGFGNAVRCDRAERIGSMGNKSISSGNDRSYGMGDSIQGKKDLNRDKVVHWAWVVVVIFLLVLGGCLVIAWFSSNDVAGDEAYRIEATCGGYGDDYLDPTATAYFEPERRGFQYGLGCDYVYGDFLNLLNTSFESGSPPDDWDVLNGNWVITAVPKVGDYAVSVQSLPAAHCNLYQFAPDINVIKGQEIVVGAWVKTTDDRGQVFARDDNGNVCVSPKHSGSNEWEWLECTGTVSSDATYCKFYCYVGYDGSIVSFLFDGYVVTYGTDELNIVFDDGDFLQEKYSYTIDGLESATAYGIRAFASENYDYYYSDDFCCMTTGGYQEFPVWMVILLVVVVALGLYTGGLLLSVVGIILCIVSYSWVRTNPGTDLEVGAISAFFIVIMGFIILSLIYRQYKKELKVL